MTTTRWNSAQRISGSLRPLAGDGSKLYIETYGAR